MAVLIVGEKPPRDILLLTRRGGAHSKYYDLACFCPKRRRRKDGTCRASDLAFEQIRPDAHERVRVIHPEKGSA